MDDGGVPAWRRPWFQRSIASLVVFTVVMIGIGFVWLPSNQRDFTAGGLWASICRAAGVPARWADDDRLAESHADATLVVLDRSMATRHVGEEAGRGATLALGCAVCHGARGLSASEVPNLAGQYPEVVLKELHDFRDGRRPSLVMQAIARTLRDEEIVDLSRFYADLPKPATTPIIDDNVPTLIRVGAPMRNIAPCSACHGDTSQKFGVPWIGGMPKSYLLEQLTSFKSGRRRNDAEAQMRNMARALTPTEIEEVSDFYAANKTAVTH